MRKVIDSNMTFDQFRLLTIKDKIKCRDQLNKHPYLLENYIKSYSKSLHSEQIKIIEGFKQKIKGDFIILKCLKENAVFIDIDEKKVYMVKALNDRFDELFDFFPVYCNATLLPFNNKIIYDGFLTSQSLRFGKNLRYEFNEIYKNAKNKNDIIWTI